MLSYPQGELALYVRQQSRLVDEAYTALEAALAQLQALSVQHGFRLRVLLIPSPSTVFGKLAILHYPEI